MPSGYWAGELRLVPARDVFDALPAVLDTSRVAGAGLVPCEGATQCERCLLGRLATGRNFMSTSKRESDLLCAIGPASQSVIAYA